MLLQKVTLIIQYTVQKFINTNILGTYNLLNCSKEYLENNISKKKNLFFSKYQQMKFMVI